jgi:hypothetical protein
MYNLKNIVQKKINLIVFIQRLPPGDRRLLE